MHTVKEISVQGEYACFSCGHGNHCPVGGFVDMFPLGTKIKSEIIPSLTNQYPENPDLPHEERNLVKDARETGKILSKVMDTRKAKLKGFKNKKSTTK
jgi:hypothetical protein